jgi:aminocarboxymuconate-semialdehyde decarboxylase
MPDFIKINGHGHLMPTPEEIPNFMRQREIFWIDSDRKFMYQKNWQRPVTDPSFFLDGKLEWMERNNIDHEVILTLSQLYCNGLNKTDTGDAIRFQNDFNAKIQTEHPEKFTTGFVVQPAYTDQALHEIERSVEELGLSLLCLPTHFLDTDEKWKSIANEKVEPILELADKYQLALEIHPYDGPKMIALENIYWRFHLVWMCAQTADTYHLYTIKSYPDIYRRLRICFAHANQFGQVNMGRRIQGYKGRPDLFEGMSSPEVYIRNTNIFYDTLVHDQLALRLLVARQGISQLIAGMDDPYPLGEMETLEGGYPGKILDEARDDGILTQEQWQEIWCDNVAEWIAGNAKEEFFKRISNKRT